MVLWCPQRTDKIISLEGKPTVRKKDFTIKPPQYVILKNMFQIEKFKMSPCFKQNLFPSGQNSNNSASDLGCPSFILLT